MNSTELRHDPRKLCSAYFSLAKNWWGAALLCKGGSIIVGVLVVSYSVLPKVSPFLVFVLAIVSEFLVWRSDKTKGIAEALLRKLDHRNSLGWEISKAEMLDILSRTSRKLQAGASTNGKQDDYFASKDDVGSIRALKNLRESAWWSNVLATRMSWYVSVIAVLAVVGSVVLLLFTIVAIRDLDTLNHTGRVVTAVLTFVLSVGLFRLIMSYYRFSQTAQHTKERASELLKHGCTEMEAVKLFSEYHLSRAGAPLVPDFVYAWHKDALNHLWLDYSAD